MTERLEYNIIKSRTGKGDKAMRTITYKELLKSDLNYLDVFNKKELMNFANQKQLNAIDILDFEKIPPKDRLWIVCNEELVDDNILHEFACRCAERVLNMIKNPDPRGVKAIEIKRKWLKGEATDDELKFAQDNVRIACSEGSWNYKKEAIYSAWYATQNSAKYASLCTAYSAWYFIWIDRIDSDIPWQINELKKLIQKKG